MGGKQGYDKESQKGQNTGYGSERSFHRTMQSKITKPRGKKGRNWSVGKGVGGAERREERYCRGKKKKAKMRRKKTEENSNALVAKEQKKAGTKKGKGKRAELETVEKGKCKSSGRLEVKQ